MGDFNVTLVKKPRYINEDKCTGCTICVKYCPVEYPDPYNRQISDNKAIHVYFSQAIPLVAYIEEESCLYLTEGKCDICRGVCHHDAIDFNQTAERSVVNVGTVILSPGMEPFDPGIKDEYGYRKLENVITSMDYERVLASTGPYGGLVLRASDKKHPQKIAWIQCVGSRRVAPDENSYCSGICCSYTQKQVILTKDHHQEASCTIFHNDVRAFGKDFERYFQKTKQLEGTRFIRSYVSIVGEMPDSKNIVVRYATTDEGVKEEEFDLVVLSGGLNPPADGKKLANIFQIELNDHGFANTEKSNPIQTSRTGVLVSGAFQGPTDIPDSVYSASGAGTLSGELLNHRRGKLSTKRVYPLERDVAEEKPKIGVFVCHCGANIGSVINVPSVVEYAATLPNVVYTQEQLFSCATNSAREITELALEKGLNRVVIGACSPRTLEPLFRDTVREAGLNPYFFEMANIREHCAWVHTKQKDEATEKAKDIIRMSVARAQYLEPLEEFNLTVNPAVLVVGGGIAGMTCALSVANQGHTVHLVEKGAELGGMAKRVHTTIEGMDVQNYIDHQIRQVYQHPLIRVSHEAMIIDVSGFVGNFSTTLKSEGRTKKINHGAAVIAIGADEYSPTEYLYGENERVITHLELGERIAEKDAVIMESDSLAMIQCVGCRNEDQNYCSRVCCSHAVKNALKLKEYHPACRIYILFRDMRTYGFTEDYYREASDKGVQFIRYEPDDKPVVEPAKSEGKDVLRVTVLDPIIGQRLELDVDVLSLAAAIIPASSTGDIASLFKVTLNPDGFFKEAHVKLRPVDFAADGIFLCGTAHYPKHITETISQAQGAAGRVVTLLSNDQITTSGAVCEVIEQECISCGACMTACTYDAIAFTETPMGKKAFVNSILCKGDGLCSTKCPTRAIVMKHFTHQAMLHQIEAAVPEIRAPL